MPSAQLRRTRMHTASHACFHKHSATQKLATTRARIQASFTPGFPNSLTCSFTQHSQKGVCCECQRNQRQSGHSREADRLCHPTERSSLFPKEVRANIAPLSHKTVLQVAKERTEEVRRWVALSTELVTKEQELKSSLSPRIAQVLKDKRLCLLETLLTEQLDLRQSRDRLCFVTNTEERVEELTNELDDALRTKALSRSEGEELRGRLPFASSQDFGRKFRRLLKVLSNHVTQGRKTLPEHTQACLSDIRKLLTQSKLKDASFDCSDYSGLGGLIVDMSKKTLSFFGTEVDKRTLDDIMAKGQKTFIQEPKSLK